MRVGPRAREAERRARAARRRADAASQRAVELGDRLKTLRGEHGHTVVSDSEQQKRRETAQDNASAAADNAEQAEINAAMRPQTDDN